VTSSNPVSPVAIPSPFRLADMRQGRSPRTSRSPSSAAHTVRPGFTRVCVQLSAISRAREVMQNLLEMRFSASRDSIDSTDPTSPIFSGRRPKPTRRLFEGRGWPGRSRQIAHRIGHLVNNGLEIIDAGHTHGAFGKFPQPCLEDGRARRQAVANRKIRRVAGPHNPGPVRFEQQVIVG
jgi:hypothetical protein